MIATCQCQHCGSAIEFDMAELTETDSSGGKVLGQSRQCPHCRKDTFLYLPKAASTIPPQLQQETIKDRAWYYSQNGKRIGPCNENQICTLITTHTIRRDSLVWCEGLVAWTPALQTDIRHLFGSAAMPPPLTGESVNNGIVWTLAFAPILAAFLQAILAAVTETSKSHFWWVALLLNIGLCCADAQKLKNAGYDKIMRLWVFLVPVYLFVRASRLKQNNGYAFVWIAAFFVSLFI
jgi:hypothetical protein